jgi:hypothetical protein
MCKRFTHKAVTFAILAILSTALVSSAASAQGFEKKNYNYSEWTKGRFSEAVTVTGPGKMIFLAGVGAEARGSANTPLTRSSDCSRSTAPRWLTSRKWSLT